MRIALTGGGTGGHFFPLLAVVREIRKIILENVYKIPAGEGTGADFMFIGPETIGDELLARENIQRRVILTGKLRRYAAWQNIFDILKIPLGIIQALWHLFFFMPNVVFSKGGYGSVPMVIAARIFKIPVIIHESDAIPGLANRFCAKLAQRIAISFAESINYFSDKVANQKIALTGNPVRQEIFDGNSTEAQKIFGLSGLKTVILILGGSQGARTLNDAIINALPSLLPRCEIIHQCGGNNLTNIQKNFNKNIPAGYFPHSFLDENQLKHAYAAAQLIISRAGAGTIAEIAALGKPSIIIPLPNSAADHQMKNAITYAKSDAAIIIDQINLTPHLFQNRIIALLDDSIARQKMSAAAKNFAQPAAANKIASEILSIAKY